MEKAFLDRPYTRLPMKTRSHFRRSRCSASGDPRRRANDARPIRRPRWCASTAPGATASAARPAACRWPRSTPPPRRSTREVAEKMIRKLRAGMMPPPGARRPDADDAARARRGARDAHRQGRRGRRPIPGGVRSSDSIASSTRARCKDLLALDVDVNGLLPPDSISHGFDNVADSQAFSPALMEGYLRAASKVTALAIGDPDARVDRSALPRAEDGVAAAPRRRRAARHARRHRRHPHLPRRRRLRASASSCTATPTASCSAARQPASRSKSRSTASARRCSTSIRTWRRSPTSLFLKTPPIHVTAGRAA